MTTKAAIRSQYQVLFAGACTSAVIGGGVLVMILTGHSDASAPVVASLTAAVVVVALALRIALRRIKRDQ